MITKTLRYISGWNEIALYDKLINWPKSVKIKPLAAKKQKRIVPNILNSEPIQKTTPAKTETTAISNSIIRKVLKSIFKISNVFSYYNLKCFSYHSI